jgi:hypothetical protein
MENATPSISVEERQKLLLPVTFEEVQRAVMAMHPIRLLVRMVSKPFSISNIGT